MCALWVQRQNSHALGRQCGFPLGTVPRTWNGSLVRHMGRPSAKIYVKSTRSGSGQPESLAQVVEPESGFESQLPHSVTLGRLLNFSVPPSAFL